MFLRTIEAKGFSYASINHNFWTPAANGKRGHSRSTRVVSLGRTEALDMRRAETLLASFRHLYQVDSLEGIFDREAELADLRGDFVEAENTRNCSAAASTLAARASSIARISWARGLYEAHRPLSRALTLLCHHKCRVPHRDFTAVLRRLLDDQAGGAPWREHGKPLHQQTARALVTLLEATEPVSLERLADLIGAGSIEAVRHTIFVARQATATDRIVNVKRVGYAMRPPRDEAEALELTTWHRAARIEGYPEAVLAEVAEAVRAER